MSGLKSIEGLFARRHFDCTIIILCVRWYLRYKLSLRDLVEMMAERGLHLAYTTIMRWLQRYVPEFEKRWNCYTRKVGRSWRVDETYLKVRGRWVYLYRAVDQDSNTVDFRLSPHRDTAAAKAFFRKVIRSQDRAPVSITLDGYAASHRTVHEMQEDGLLPRSTELRCSKYLNNLIDKRQTCGDHIDPCTPINYLVIFDGVSNNLSFQSVARNSRDYNRSAIWIT
jgi:transposase-like protein